MIRGMILLPFRQNFIFPLMALGLMVAPKSWAEDGNWVRKEVLLNPQCTPIQNSAGGVNTDPALTMEKAQVLVDKLMDESHSDEWDALKNEIRGFKQAETKPLLIKLLHHPRPAVRAEATLALAQIADQGDADLVLEMAQNHDWQQQVILLYLAFPRIDDPRQEPIIRGLLKHENPKVRAAAIRLVGIKNIKDAVPQLKIFAKDNLTEIRAAAKQALQDLGQGTD